MVVNIPTRSLALAFGVSSSYWRRMALALAIQPEEEPANAQMVVDGFNRLYPSWAEYRERLATPAIRKECQMGYLVIAPSGSKRKIRCG